MTYEVSGLGLKYGLQMFYMVAYDFTMGFPPAMELVFKVKPNPTIVVSCFSMTIKTTIWRYPKLGAPLNHMETCLIEGTPKSSILVGFSIQCTM